MNAGFNIGSKPNQKIALIDADLMDGGTRHPNLALLKMSGWAKAQGHSVRLLCSYDELEPDLFRLGADEYDAIAVSQVFSFTKRPDILNKLIDSGKVMYGGTGFFEVGGPRLPEVVEHHMPDYHLYDEYIKLHPDGHWDDYTKASIGFTTRGCFRKCPFCVNREYNRVQRHAKVAEFFDPTRPRIYLWDDNFMAAGERIFNEVMDELEATRKRFQFRQGLDIRLMTRKKAERLAAAKYYGDYIFAFDHVDEPTVKATLRGLNTWREYSTKNTKVYVLVGFDSQDEKDIFSMFRRIELLMSFNCVPYIMRHELYRKSQWRKLYTLVARWCNQQALFKKKSFTEYLSMPGNENVRFIADDFAKLYPNQTDYYYNMKLRSQYENENMQELQAL